MASLRQQGTLLGLRFVRRGQLHPAFQFDRAAERVDPTVTKINRVLMARLSVADAILCWLAPADGGPEPLMLLNLCRARDYAEEVDGRRSAA